MTDIAVTAATLALDIEELQDEIIKLQAERDSFKLTSELVIAENERIRKKNADLAHSYSIMARKFNIAREYVLSSSNRSLEVLNALRESVDNKPSVPNYNSGVDYRPRSNLKPVALDD